MPDASSQQDRMQRSARESVKMKLERISVLSSETSQESEDVPITPRERNKDNLPDSPGDVFEDRTKEDNCSTSQLVANEENNSCTQPQQEFTGNFLFNSINGALKRKNSGQQLDLPATSTSTTSTTSAENASQDKASPQNGQQQPNPSQPQRNTHNSSGSQSAQDLYKPYRTDTKEMDQSEAEYTAYQRETLV